MDRRSMGNTSTARGTFHSELTGQLSIGVTQLQPDGYCRNT